SLTDESITNTGTKQGSKSVLMKVAVLSGTAFGQTVESYVRITKISVLTDIMKESVGSEEIYSCVTHGSSVFRRSLF
ncbi:MAG: hypothetical protein IJM47_09900, partial [Synergistaceae bacterium]|nr:hypothetical protein [Synergistaceae bacterium]